MDLGTTTQYSSFMDSSINGHFALRNWVQYRLIPEFSGLGYHAYGTRAHETRVPSGIFKYPDAMSSCHGGIENRELEFSELEY